jgi:hypothetical protein
MSCSAEGVLSVEVAEAAVSAWGGSGIAMWASRTIPSAMADPQTM